MNEHYAKRGKFFDDSDGVREAAEAISRTDLTDFFSRYVSGAAEIPWNNFFVPLGLQVTKATVSVPQTGFDAVQQFDQPPTVVLVYSGSDAEQAGLAAGDVITRIDRQPVGRDFERELAKLKPGQFLQLTVSRGGIERQLTWKLGSRSRTVYRVEDMPGVTPQQRTRRREWLFDGVQP